jgi:hypothetical protein
VPVTLALVIADRLSAAALPEWRLLGSASLGARLPVAGLHLPIPIWWFYALGPQLLLCLGLGFLAWRRRGGEQLMTAGSKGDLLDWLTWSFLASLVPVAGVALMIWLWWRSPKRPRGGEDAAAAAHDPADAGSRGSGATS